MVTPEEWLENFESKIADVKQKAAELQANLEASGATESTADGQLTVTVAPNGALTGLSIDDAALLGSGEELAAKIMRLARKAQRAATGLIPPEEDEPEQDERRGYSFTRDDDEDFGNELIFGRRDDS